MARDDPVQLDARLAWVLHIGLPEPRPSWGRPEYLEMELVVERMRARADAGDTIVTGREQIAGAVAELAELNDPTREETIDVLVALVLDIQQSGAIGDHGVYLIGGIDDFGWPLHDPNERIVEHLIAAVDLGLFDLPGQRRTRPPPLPEPGPNRPVLAVLKELQPIIGHVDAGGDTRSSPPTEPAPPPALRELFLRDWERALGGIVERIFLELGNGGYVDFSAG
ncbi:MAG: hypothetical protein M3Z27_05620 [Actinomycetota bacterium]|nr:hypothetical protein [Actinomycetota bacterium]